MIKWVSLSWRITDKYVMTMLFMKLLHLKGRLSPTVARWFANLLIDKSPSFGTFECLDYIQVPSIPRAREVSWNSRKCPPSSNKGESPSKSFHSIPASIQNPTKLHNSTYQSYITLFFYKKPTTWRVGSTFLRKPGF